MLRWFAACALASLALSLWYVWAHPDGVDKVSSGETTLLWKNVLSFNPLARLPEFLAGMLTGQLFLQTRARLSSALALPLGMAGLLIVAAMTLLVGKIPSPFISAGFLSPAFADGLPTLPHWLRVVSAMVAALAAALLCFLLLEQPARRWLRPGRRVVTSPASDRA